MSNRQLIEELGQKGGTDFSGTSPNGTIIKKEDLFPFRMVLR